MFPADPLTPTRRDALLALVALGLLAGPLWAPALELGGTVYHYDRTEVTTDGTGIQYANEGDGSIPPGAPISEDIACSGWHELRPCAFERLLLENQTVPTKTTTNNPDAYPGRPLERYEYVLVNDTVYEPTYAPNRSAQDDDGWYRVDLGLEQVAPDETLRRVSLRIGSDEVPSTVAEVARDGEVTTRNEVDVPATPIRLTDGTYYRVYQDGYYTDTSWLYGTLDWVLRYCTPLVALPLIARLRTRIEYVGPRR